MTVISTFWFSQLRFPREVIFGKYIFFFQPSWQRLMVVHGLVYEQRHILTLIFIILMNFNLKGVPNEKFSLSGILDNLMENMRSMFSYF